jgi:hypothetical protein
MQQRDVNIAIAIIVIALFAMGAAYIITRVSSVQSFGNRGVGGPVQSAENDDFSQFNGVVATTTATGSASEGR